MATRLTAADFFSGLLAVLVLKGLDRVSLSHDRFDQAAASAFSKLMEIAPEQGIDVRFRVRLHPIHGDSLTVHNGIVDALGQDMGGLVNPTYQDISLKLSRERAEALLEQLPCGRPLYDILGAEFLASYSYVA